MTGTDLAVTDMDDMRHLAEGLAGRLRRGDVLVLTGDLGAGKTTFTQFLGTALGVGGRISSPTFVLAREHANTGDGPGLVHVDAYRLGDADEFADLDLDSDLSEVVTVVEWGHGMAEQLNDDRVEIVITRRFEEAWAPADLTDLDTEDENRRITLLPSGTDWTARVADLAAWYRAGTPDDTSAPDDTSTPDDSEEDA
ncbi:tRNA (adenosine(37)-N6)-threonylcarbamoyltransferase complex ATPase subunit type 1 TsaE [Brevibacterium litoralis]|uniref:tRNA (adenosine(37)-N6)-threonylcarbamoyltransferase complex ATPase subunit type 1 TsaE n=1 Tax=Brevibacterium litoralis TaxID=3138935 RepID=UPI0032F06806